MQLTHENRPLSRRDLILERAEEHFAENGFRGASLSAIARDCDVSNPGLLHHFPSKETLYRAVLERQARELMERMDTEVMCAGDSAACLNAFLLLQIDWMSRRRTGFRLIIRELLDNSERVKTARTLPLERFLKQAVGLLEQAQTDKIVRTDCSAIVILTMILGTLNYAQIVRPTFNEVFKSAELRTEAGWMKIIARDVLRITGAFPVE